MLAQIFLFVAMLLFNGVAAAPSTALVMENGKLTDIDRMHFRMQEIEKKLIWFNSSITEFHADKARKAMPQLLHIQHRSMSLGKAIKQATRDVQRCHHFNEVESGRLASWATRLVPSVNSTLSNILRHKSDFETAVMHNGSITNSVASELQDQAMLSDKFAEAMREKLTPTFQHLAPIITTMLNAQYGEVILEFSKTHGIYDMPNMGGFFRLLKDKMKVGWAKFKHEVRLIFSRKYRKKHCTPVDEEAIIGKYLMRKINATSRVMPSSLVPNNTTYVPVPAVYPGTQAMINGTLYTLIPAYETRDEPYPINVSKPPYSNITVPAGLADPDDDDDKDGVKPDDVI